MVPTVVCDFTGLKDVTKIWPSGTHSRVMHAGVLEVCRPFQFMLRSDIIDADYWLQNPWNGVFHCIEKRMLFNASGTRKKTSSYCAMIDPRPFRQFDHKRRWLAEHYQFVPALVWSNGCETHSDMGLQGSQWGGQWWPMIINAWVPAWNIFHQYDPDLFWGMCPALVVNGGRPWPVHRSRIYMLTNEILDAEEAEDAEAEDAEDEAEAEAEAEGKGEGKKAEPSEMGESTATPPSEGTAPSESTHWSSSQSSASWQHVEPAPSESTQSSWRFEEV